MEPVASKRSSQLASYREAVGRERAAKPWRVMFAAAGCGVAGLSAGLQLAGVFPATFDQAVLAAHLPLLFVAVGLWRLQLWAYWWVIALLVTDLLVTLVDGTLVHALGPAFWLVVLLPGEIRDRFASPRSPLRSQT